MKEIKTITLNEKELMAFLALFSLNVPQALRKRFSLPSIDKSEEKIEQGLMSLEKRKLISKDKEKVILDDALVAFVGTVILGNEISTNVFFDKRTNLLVKYVKTPKNHIFKYLDTLKRVKFFFYLGRLSRAIVGPMFLVLIAWSFAFLAFIDESMKIAWQGFGIGIIAVILSGVLGAFSYFVFKKYIQLRGKVVTKNIKREKQMITKINRLHGLILLLIVLAPLWITLKISFALLIINLCFFVLIAIFSYFNASVLLVLNEMIAKRDKRALGFMVVICFIFFRLSQFQNNTLLFFWSINVILAATLMSYFIAYYINNINNKQ